MTIVDYGSCNVASIANMLKRVGVTSIITNDPEKIKDASKLILPGIGVFDIAMASLKEKGLLEILEKKVILERTPILGICLGMQLLTGGSEEGKINGLGWIPGYAYKFSSTVSLKVPHMKWNHVQLFGPSILTKEINENARFYFVHSYYVKVDDPRHSILQTDYGIRFDSGIQRDNIMGVQFHPEKSHKYGMRLLSSFAGM